MRSTNREAMYILPGSGLGGYACLVPKGFEHVSEEVVRRSVPEYDPHRELGLGCRVQGVVVRGLGFRPWKNED